MTYIKTYKSSLLDKDIYELSKDLNEYRSAWEFENPFFVIVHAGKDDEPFENLRLNKGLLARVKREIAEIKTRYEHVEMNEWPPQTIPRGIPRNRPILVCGFFRDVCVRIQRDSLIAHGYDAHISMEGSY